MLSGLKIYKVKDFLRKTETGNIDLKRSKQIVRELAMAAGLHTNHNILIDLRETSVSVANIEDIMKVKGIGSKTFESIQAKLKVE